MITTPGRFLRLGERAAHHDCVGAASQRFANVAALAHAAVGNDRHIPRCFFEVSVARCRAVHSGSDLRDSESKHTARSASSSGPDTNQDRSRPALHYFKSHVVSDCVSHDHGDAHLAAKFFKVERLVLRRNMADGGNRTLHNENVSASFLSNPPEFRRSLRNRTYRGYNTRIFNLAHARRNQVLLDWFL